MFQMRKVYLLRSPVQNTLLQWLAGSTWKACIALNIHMKRVQPLATQIKSADCVFHTAPFAEWGGVRMVAKDLAIRRYVAAKKPFFTLTCQGMETVAKGVTLGTHIKFSSGHGGLPGKCHLGHNEWYPWLM